MRVASRAKSVDDTPLIEPHSRGGGQMCSAF